MFVEEGFDAVVSITCAFLVPAAVLSNWVRVFVINGAFVAAKAFVGVFVVPNELIAGCELVARVISAVGVSF